jgi:chemotaxis methyl-accepting protein methylase
MAEEKELTEEAKKQRKKREKAAAKDAALGVEKFTVEVAGVFKPDLKRVMAAHGINNQQEVYQLLLMNLIAGDFETQAKMLQCVTTPFLITEKVSLEFRNESLAELARYPGDEVFNPTQIM